MSEEFLKKLHEMTGEDYKTIDKYEVGQKLGLSNSETDNIVDDLYHNSLIKKIIGTKIHITAEGKDAVINKL